MSKENCDIIDIGRWLLDIISDMMGCNCKKAKAKANEI